ncbi:MAG: fibrobacter succinogenes major paralogous domain-containing protein [Flavobacterium sp.]|nr:fibrobacter succinogenes major paralogous domain-containing protein [Flavobacterium sp.]
MRKCYFTISSILFFALGLSCTKEETKIQNQQASRPTAPEQNGKVRIGSQDWMTKNLNVSHYRNGDPIPQVTNTTQWANLTTGAWCYFQNNTSNGPVYGKLYNWYAVNDPRGLAPAGWHIPSDAEWITFAIYVDGVNGGASAGGKMKARGTIEEGTGLWLSPNVDATNSTGFTGIPGSGRAYNGNFNSAGDGAFWWSSTQSSTGASWIRYVTNDNGSMYRWYLSWKSGNSVRCIKD